MRDHAGVMYMYVGARGKDRFLHMPAERAWLNCNGTCKGRNGTGSQCMHFCETKPRPASGLAACLGWLHQHLPSSPQPVFSPVRHPRRQLNVRQNRWGAIVLLMSFRSFQPKTPNNDRASDPDSKRRGISNLLCVLRASVHRYARQQVATPWSSLLDSESTGDNGAGTLSPGASVFPGRHARRLSAPRRWTAGVCVLPCATSWT